MSRLRDSWDAKRARSFDGAQREPVGCLWPPTLAAGRLYNLKASPHAPQAAVCVAVQRTCVREADPEIERSGDRTWEAGGEQFVYGRCQATLQVRRHTPPLGV